MKSAIQGCAATGGAAFAQAQAASEHAPVISLLLLGVYHSFICLFNFALFFGRMLTLIAHQQQKNAERRFLLLVGNTGLEPVTFTTSR